MAEHKYWILLLPVLFRIFIETPSQNSTHPSSRLPGPNYKMSRQNRSQDRHESKEKPALDRMETAGRYDDVDAYLAHPLLSNTKNRDILQDHIYLRGKRASSNLSSSSIDSRLADSTTTGTHKTRHPLTDTEHSTADYGERDESGSSDASMTTLPATTYVPDSSRSAKGKSVDRGRNSGHKPKLKTLDQGVYSTLRRRGDLDHRMLFFDLDKYTAEEMHKRIDSVKESLNDMIGDLANVMTFLEEHVGPTYCSAVEHKIFKTIETVQGTCEWMRETVVALANGRIPADQTSKLEDR